MTNPSDLLREMRRDQAHDPDDETVSTAAIYARTSSVSQEFGYSIDEQVRQCWNRCEMFDWEVSHVFRDEAESGKDTERPMFQRMLDRAAEAEFDVLVFWKLDRFSRSIMHAVQLEAEFREWGVALHSVTEQIDTTTPAGRFNFRNIANAAEFERDSIKQRTRMGHLARALEHKWPNGTPPLGYVKDQDGRLEIVDDEAELVRTIFSLYIEHRSMPTVAAVLNERGCTTKAGVEWDAREVGKILRNQIYIGEYNVGGVEEHVPEYQIVANDRFEQATTVRHRFQSEGSASRGAMDKPRKKSRVSDLLGRYMEYLKRY